MTTLEHTCPGKNIHSFFKKFHHEGPKQPGLVGGVTAYGGGAGMKPFQPKQFYDFIKPSLQGTCLKFTGEEELLSSGIVLLLHTMY